VKCTQDIASKCELACSAARDTPSAGGIHPRDKKPVGDRLGAAAFNTVYGGQEAATGPTLSGCAVDATSLTVSFNSSLLKGDTINLQKYGLTSLSFFEVQTDASSFCLEPRQNISADGKTRISYCPIWAGGNGSVATGPLDSGWISLDIKLGPQGQSIVADLSPLQGALPTAVRYAWNVVNCCDPADPDLYVKYPCGPSSCPIMSKQTNLPANPFVAKIVNNKCECVAPMQCSN
jgi:sialate O-acetylesterase